MGVTKKQTEKQRGEAQDGERDVVAGWSRGGGSWPTLALKLFRGEPAISGFDWHFTPTPGSSPGFSTPVGSPALKSRGMNRG